MKSLIERLRDEGYDVASQAEIEGQIIVIEQASSSIWECIKKARTDTLVAAAGAHLDSIDYSLERIKQMLING